MLLKSLVFLAAICIVSANRAIVPSKFFADISDRIWNGRNAAPGQFPYQGLLYMTNTDGNHSFCGGSLINKNTVLTAAHCCVDVSSTLVFLGLVRVSDANASFVQRFQVPSTDFSIHEQYNARTIANDICLLHLPSEAIINKNVSTIDLPTQKDLRPQQYDFQAAGISGWGQTNSFEGIHPILQYSTVRMQPHFICAVSYSFINQVSNSQLCSGKIPYTGPCHGDSGGPLTIVDNQTNRRVEIGLVSWGVGRCSSFNPVVYTYIPAFSDWIKSNLK